MPIYLLLASLALIPCHAVAQDSSKLIERMRAADANRDGTVTRPELLTWRATNFSQIDRDRDGFLSESDVPFFMRRSGGPIDIQAMTLQYDANRDGKVSRTEFVSGPTVLFDLADRNKDGLVTKTELDAAIVAAKAQGR
jgi:Ca2+-binding EF-hand superfamily protein